MYSFLRPASGLFLGLALLASGCDSASTGGSTSDLIDDARIARQSGDVSAAIDLYTQALRQEPNNAVVRTELAGAHLERAHVDLLDLTNFVDFMTDAAASAPAAPAGTAGRGSSSCSYAEDPTATVIDPRTAIDFEEVFNHRDVIQLAMSILEGEGPVPGGEAVIPAEITGFSVCTGVQNGEIVMNRDAALAEMRAHGLTNQQIASALAVDGLSRFIDAYFYVTEDLPQATTWYRLADGSIGICAADPEQLQQDAEGAVQNIGRAVASLDLRATVLNAGPTDPVREIVDDAVDAYSAVQADLAPYCTI